MTRIADTNIKTAREQDLAASIANITGLDEAAVRARIDETHGRTLVANAFADEWPTTAAAFEGMTAAWVRDYELYDEVAAVTGLTARTVKGRLGKAHGKSHVQNVLEADWPDDDSPEHQSLTRDGAASAQSSLPFEKTSGGRQIPAADASPTQMTSNDDMTTTSKTSSKDTASPTKASAKKAKKSTKKGKAKAERARPEKTGSLGFERKLWDAADVLRNNMDPSEYKHVVLGLLFLKYIEDAFEERRDALRASVSEPGHINYVDEAKREAWLEELLEERDEYTAQNVFWVPKQARWSHLQGNAKQPTIGKVVDDAMDAIEKENESLRGVLPKIFARPNLSPDNLGKLIDLVSNIGLGTAKDRSKDTLGRVYEYFLSRFAGAEGKGGGEFFTPTTVVRLLVEMLQPYQGRVYDPCCGSGGMFVQSLKFIEAHDGQRKHITVYGQESNHTTWRLARMNLAIRGIDAKLGDKHADSFHHDHHPDLRADFILANPPFNISEWGGERLQSDVRWKYGTPPTGNANFAWVQHFVHHLAPGGTAGFVLANGSMSSMQSGEGDIRKALVDADLVDCIVACPGQLFYATQIPVCLWFLTKNKGATPAQGQVPAHRDRRGETLFIDARKLGRMESRVHRVFDEEHLAQVADTYHAWRNVSGDSAYEDVAGFCKSETREAIAKHDYVLTPGRYVGAEEVEDDGEPFEEKMARLTGELSAQMAEGAELDARIREALGGLGYGV